MSQFFVGLNSRRIKFNTPPRAQSDRAFGRKNPAIESAGAAPIPVSIIGKGRTTRNLTGSWSVPKGTLMQRVAVAMEQGHLKITCDDVMAKALAHEAHSFVRKMNALGHVTCGGRGARDDLILAVALAIWARAEASFAKSLFAA